MASISKRRVRNYLVGDLDCIFNERLVHLNFLNPTQVAEEYEKLTEKKLEADLALLGEDLFDIVEGEFSQDFLVNRLKQNIGFYRMRDGIVISPPNSSIPQLGKMSAQDHILKQEESSIDHEERDDWPDPIVKAIPMHYVESWHHKNASNTHEVCKDNVSKVSASAIPLPLPDWEEKIKKSENERHLAGAGFAEVVIPWVLEEQTSNVIPLPPPFPHKLNASSAASEDSFDCAGKSTKGPLSSSSTQKFRLFKQKPNIYPKIQPLVDVELSQSSEPKAAAYRFPGSADAEQVMITKSELISVREVMPCGISVSNAPTMSLQTSYPKCWYDEFGLDDFDLDEEDSQPTINTARAILPKPVEKASRLDDWKGVKETLDDGCQVQFYWLNGHVIQNYEKTFVQRSCQCTEMLDSLEFSSIPSHWLSSASNAGSVFNCLFKLNDCYPGGCTAKQLAEFEKSLSVSMAHFGLKGSLPCFASLYDCGLLLLTGGLYFVAAGVLTKFIFLRKNFCSNIYRLLRNNDGMVTMQSLEHVKNMFPPNISMEAKDVISLCNRYPLLFSLISSKEDNYHVKHAAIKLNQKIPDWLVVWTVSLIAFPVPSVIARTVAFRAKECMDNGKSAMMISPEIFLFDHHF
uniref:Uncharacterized protein n=1 Tax=Ditylenchus dipsaci TaxID=166011 RepID=A0A915EJG3_9BILA